MNKQEIQNIIEAACETADSIVGARAWKTPEDAKIMHDVIFLEMLAKHLQGLTIAELLEILTEEKEL